VNPYASLYEDTTRTLPQLIPSRFAIMDIHRKGTSGPDAQIMVADLYINNWSGTITQNTTWTNNVHVSGDITVASGVTLTIRSRVQVAFEPGFDDRAAGDYTGKGEIFVQGSLVLQGTTRNPVVFTSAADSPQNGDWGGIVIRSGGSLTGTQYQYLYASRSIIIE
jgi:hypothetical protein